MSSCGLSDLREFRDFSLTQQKAVTVVAVTTNMNASDAIEIAIAMIVRPSESE